MELLENTENVSNIINSIDSNNITINNQKFNQSCIVSNQKIITDLSINAIEKLNSTVIDYLLSNNPELIIIGSGMLHTFPDIKHLQPIAERNIGFEVMNNHSASITYNVLVAEERQVSCLLILDNFLI